MFGSAFSHLMTGGTFIRLRPNGCAEVRCTWICSLNAIYIYIYIYSLLRKLVPGVLGEVGNPSLCDVRFCSHNIYVLMCMYIYIYIYIYIAVCRFRVTAFPLFSSLVQWLYLPTGYPSAMFSCAGCVHNRPGLLTGSIGWSADWTFPVSGQRKH